MTWTSNVKTQIEIIHKRCLGYKWIYSHMIEQYNTLEFRLIIPVLIIGPIISVLSTLIQYFNEIFIIQIIIAVLGVTVSILGGIYKYMDCQGSIYIAKSYLGRYSNLCANIERQIMLPIESREDATAYISWLTGKYEDIITYEPTIDSDTVALFLRKFVQYKQCELPDMILNMSNIPQVALTAETPVQFARTPLTKLRDIKLNPIRKIANDDKMKKEISKNVISSLSIELAKRQVTDGPTPPCGIIE